MRENHNPTMGLPLEDGMLAYSGMTLSVWVLNPHSRNKDTAIRYLQTVAEHMDPCVRFTLAPEEAMPTRESRYEEVIERFDEAIFQLKQRLDAAKDDEKPKLKAQLKDLERAVIAYDARSWAVSEELIAQYKALARGIVVYKNAISGGYEGAEGAEVHSAIERYLAGQMNREAFVAQLDQKVRAMALEGN